MQRFCHRIVIAALASLMFIPLGLQAQEQSKDQSSQPQSGSQTKGKQWSGRRAAAQRQRQHMAMLAEKLGLTGAQKPSFSRSIRTCASKAWPFARTAR
jgi:hypothetical protein